MSELEPKPQPQEVTPEFRQLLLAMNRFSALGKPLPKFESILYDGLSNKVNSDTIVGQTRATETSLGQTNFKLGIDAHNEIAGMSSSRNGNGAVRLGYICCEAEFVPGTSNHMNAYMSPWSDGSVAYYIDLSKDQPPGVFDFLEKLGITDIELHDDTYSRWTWADGDLKPQDIAQLTDTINGFIIDSLPGSRSQ